MATLEELLAEKARRQSLLDQPSAEELDSHPLESLSVSDLPGAAAHAVGEGVKKLKEMSPGEIGLEVVKAPWTIAKGVARGVYEQGKEIVEDPRRAIAPVLQTAGAAAGALTGNPALVYGGSIAGRAIGEGIESMLFNKPLLNAESALDVAAAGFGSVFGQAAGGTARGVYRAKKFLEEGAANTARYTGQQAEKVTLGEAARKWATESADAMGGQGEAAKLRITRPTLDDPITETTFDPKIKQPYTETRASGYKYLYDEEGNILDAVSPIRQRADQRVALLQEQADKVRNTPIYSTVRAMGKTGMETIADTVKYAMEGGMNFHDATAVALQHELNQKKALYQVAQMVTTPSEWEKFGLSETENQMEKIKRELYRVRRNQKEAFDLTQAATGGEIYEPKLTAAQRKLRGTMKAEESMLEELAKLNDNALDKLPDYQKMNIDQFRGVVDVMPEATKHPFVKAMGEYLGPLASLRPVQAVLRQSGDPFLIHIANSLVHADETHRGVTDHFIKVSQDFFKKNPLTDVDKVYIQTLERDPEMFKMLKPLIGSADPVVAYQTLKAFAPSVQLDQREMAPLLKAAGHIVGWQQEVGDPLFNIAVRLAKDAGQIPPMRAEYMTSTFSPRYMLDDLMEQHKRVSDLLTGIQQGDPLANRLGQSLSIIQNKIDVARHAAEREATKLRDWRSLALGTDRPIPKELFSSELTGKKSDMGISLDVERASEQYIHNIVKKMVYDRVVDTGHETLKAWKKNIVEQGKDLNAVNGLANFVQNAILDQTGTRRTIANQKLVENMARVSPVGAKIAEHLDASLQNISQLHYLLNIAFKPAFYAMNLMQNFLTLYPLVDTEAFSKGFAKVIFDKDNAIKEATEVGALQEGLNTLWKEDTKTTVAKWSKKLGLEGGVQATENFNRMVAYFAGKHDAELRGLKGDAAIKRALDTVAESNFLYSAAHRPQITNTPIGAAAMRYKSFALNYAEFIRQAVKSKQWSRASSAIAALWATAGTSGIPLYSWTQDRLASMGVYLPKIDPLEQVLGFDIQGADTPFPTLPQSPQDLAGPLGAMAINAGEAVYQGLNGGDYATPGGKALRAGGMLTRAASAVDELVRRRGETFNAGHTELTMERNPEQVFMGLVGLGPTGGQLKYDTQRDLLHADEAGDMGALREAIEESRAKGIRNQAAVIARIRAKRTADRNQSLLYSTLGGR